MHESYKEDYFEIEVLQDASAEFDAAAECTCTQDDPPPPCSSCNSIF